MRNGLGQSFNGKHWQSAEAFSEAQQVKRHTFDHDDRCFRRILYRGTVEDKDVHYRLYNSLKLLFLRVVALYWHGDVGSFA